MKKELKAADGTLRLALLVVAAICVFMAFTPHGEKARGALLAWIILP